MSSVNNVTVETGKPDVDFIVLRNASEYDNEKLEPIELLFERLNKHPIAPLWGIDGVKKTLEVNAEYCTEKQITFDGHCRYFGRFWEVGATFEIWVMRGSQIEKALDKLIEDNLNTPAYLKALIQHTR